MIKEKYSQAYTLKFETGSLSPTSSTNTLPQLTQTSSTNTSRYKSHTQYILLAYTLLLVRFTYPANKLPQLTHFLNKKHFLNKYTSSTDTNFFNYHKSIHIIYSISFTRKYIIIGQIYFRVHTIFPEQNSITFP